ncbi:MAG: glycosyltransferase, partial [Deltaproteobacteria bacterium]|nr:glycosyltransferase [Deltaproteobacteria bacterium]
MEQTKRPLKILHVDHEKGWAGGQTQVVGLLSYLASQKHENHLLCHPDGALQKKVKNLGFRTFPLKVKNDLDLLPVFRLKKLIREKQYDIVHFHTKRAHALAFWLGQIHPGLNYVVTRRMDYRMKKNWYNDRLYNKQVDGVIAISEKIASLLVEGGVNRDKIRVIHSGIDPTPFEGSLENESNSTRLVVGTVAVLEQRKGHRYLLEAAKILKDQGIRLRYLFAGEGPERNYLEQLVLKWGLQDEVAFMGFVTDIPAFLAGIDIFVLPSLFEGLGVSVIEAMAAGKPVVASQVGGIPELVEEHVTGQ